MYDGKIEISPTEYWREHYVPGRVTATHNCALTSNSLNLIIVNSLTSISFLYLQHFGQEDKLRDLMELLHDLPPEVNRFTKLFASHNIHPKDIIESQGIIHLHKTYCQPRNCLKCKIGATLISGK